MSSGAFQTATYQSDANTVHRIRVQPETLALTLAGAANNPIVGTIDSPFAAQSGTSRRSYGLHARLVRFKFLEGSVPAGYLPQSTLQLPWLDRTTFNAIQAGQQGTYLGSTIEVIGKSPEVSR
jgi:hypothetical protein